MALFPLQCMPFSNIDNTQLLLLFANNVTNLSVSSPNNLNTSSLSNDVVPTDNFEKFLVQNDDLQFFTMCKYYAPADVIQCLQPQSSFFILHLNARSLPKNFNKLKLLLIELQINPSVICITETWFTNFNYKSYYLPGYTLEVINRQDKIGGGICNYIRNDITYKIIENPLLVLNPSFECIIAKLTLSTNNSSLTIVIVTIYRPPNTCLDLFNEQLNKTLLGVNKTIKNKKCLFIIGDFNIDLSKINQHSTTLNFFNTLLSLNLFPTITKPTRVTEFSSTLIDNIFISDLQHIKYSHTSGIIYSDLSDHFPCFINLFLNDTNNVTLEDDLICSRKYTTSNYTKFNHLLKTIDWTKYNSWSNTNDVNLYFDSFHNEFSTIFDEAFPITNPNKTKAKNSRLPWLTPAIISSCKTKNKLFIKYKKYPSILNLISYKNYNSTLQHCIKQAEQKYYLEKLQNKQKDIKAKWQLINIILNRNNMQKLPTSFTINHNQTTDKKQIAESFNSYYINLGSSLATKVPTSNLSPYEYLKNKHYTSAVFLHSCDQEVIEVINNLKNESSPGWDNIPNSIIKFAKHFISKPLTNIINCMLSTGCFPDQLKIAKVIPCFKSGDKSQITNYRPISILNAFSKIFENIIVIRLKNYIAKYNILYKFQFGFREKYSTNLALTAYMDFITKSIDSGDKVASVFIDLSKAFDTLNHEILLKKLYLYGIRGQTLALLTSYLSNRKQYVQFSNFSSTLQIINCGVPQGSILGPILFLLYINDIHCCSTILKIILFADDTTLSLKHKNINVLYTLLNAELSKISEWMKANKLSINVSKTFYILFRSSVNNIINNKLLIDACEVKNVSHIKFLGVFIDDKLSWREHIKYLECKLSAIIGVLSKIRYKVNSEVCNLIYDALIVSQLEYCNIIWASGYKSVLAKLESLQVRALKICNRFDYKLSKLKTFDLSNRLSLTQLNKFNILKFVFLTLKYNTSNLFHDFYIINKNRLGYANRMQNNIFIAGAKTNIRKMFVANAGSILWNKLPDTVKSTVYICSFKTEIKHLLLNSSLFS
jgi:hypothetical protein